ncbi:MAG: GGDEF domain-containing phosphodiesterase [Lachnospiraceae bacterium]|nr:GGDEF domain-containing phosphodiesterase [Lachnospiraceae bacterium]
MPKKITGIINGDALTREESEKKLNSLSKAKLFYTILVCIGSVALLIYSILLYFTRTRKGLPVAGYSFLIEAALLLMMIGSFVLIQKLANKVREIKEEMLVIDNLTCLPIKQKHKMIVEELIKDEHFKYAYVTFDINKFKYVNDVFGYDYGNEVISHIGSTIREMLRPFENATRSMSDDFSMLLYYNTIDELEARLMNFFEEAGDTPFVQGKPRCMISFTCGIYLIKGGETINSIRSYANIARKSNKNSFATNFCYYDEAFHEERLREREMECDMYTALDNKEFIVYLQPKYEISSDTMTGAEALIRWKHSRMGLLTPNKFVQLFEENGFIKLIDFYVLEVVCQRIQHWMQQGVKPVPVSVNLSRLHIMDSDLTERLCAITRKYDVPNSFIEFELTETIVLEEMDALLQTMAKLKDAGFTIAMDDFGTGYSSLNLLRKIPVDVLKLDKEFFESDGQVYEDDRDKSIIHHIIAMAKDLKINVLAEGVETKEQLEFLRSCDCDMIQGYYYSKPLPIEEFERRNKMVGA